MATRECRDDFIKIKKYISAYNLKNFSSDKNYINNLTRMHKKYFSLVCWQVEINENKNKIKYNYTATDVSIRYISESISDIALAYFNWLHGCYRPCKILLRASIENFIRGISHIEDRSQLWEKNTYKLIEKAQVISLIKNKASTRKLFSLLKQDYKILCSDVHTASQVNMAGISCLEDFPSYEKKQSDICEKYFLNISKVIVTMLCLIFMDVFLTLHHRSRSNILDSTIREYRPEIHGLN